MLDATPLELPEVLLIRPRVFPDDRGRFLQTWTAGTYAEAGVSSGFVQDNESLSVKRGTLRGLHFQAPPEAQAKLVRAVHGSIFDVAVDIRRSSPNYGKWCGAVLTAEGAEQLYIPHGFAHGFCTLEENVIVNYKVDGGYAPKLEGGILWNDPDIGIDWPVPEAEMLLSPKDRVLPSFSDFETPFE